ncbi:hypothetical protein TNCV_325021 [Trichonephila clavipes]|nr:hypothetical protein TNCV_325021 [Trichonephila clavipes]
MLPDGEPWGWRIGKRILKETRCHFWGGDFRITKSGRMVVGDIEEIINFWIEKGDAPHHPSSDLLQF